MRAKTNKHERIKVCSRIGDSSNPPFGNSDCREYAYTHNMGVYKSEAEPKNPKTLKRNRQKRLAKLETLQKEYWNWNQRTKHNKVKYKFATFLKLKQKRLKNNETPATTAKTRLAKTMQNTPENIETRNIDCRMNLSPFQPVGRRCG